MAGLAHQLASNWWLKRGVWAWAFRDVSWVVAWIAKRRRAKFIQKPPTPLPVPLIVVGNVIAGGAGKTPIVIALGERYAARGMKIGVISRGAGRAGEELRQVNASDAARDVGDEPLLIATRLNCPVFVGKDRAAAARALLAAHPDTQLILSDDGLQHHALWRSAEVIVFDERGIGNGWCLPAGPLREPWPRAANPVVPEVWLSRASTSNPTEAVFPEDAHLIQRRLSTHATQADGTRRELAEFGDLPCIAIAGIAQPEAFFSMLRHAGLTLAHTEALPDHYHFDSYTLSKYQDSGAVSLEKPVFCTEKDAVKLWKTYPQVWAVQLEVEISESALLALDQMLGALAWS